MLRVTLIACVLVMVLAAAILYYGNQAFKVLKLDPRTSAHSTQGYIPLKKGKDL